MKKEFKNITEEEIENLSSEEYAAYKAYVLENLKDELRKEFAKESEANAEKMQELQAEINKTRDEQIETLKTAMVKQGDAMAKMELRSKSTGNVLTVKELLTEKEEEIKAIKSSPLSIMVIKASQAPADIADRTDLAARIPGVEPLARRRVFVRDFFNVVSTDTEYIRKTEQDVVVRDAKNVAQCAASTHTTKLTWKQTTLQQKKIRDFVHVCIDMMEDYDFVEGEIRDLINYGVTSQEDSQLLLGDGTGSNLNGIASYASTFAANLAGADYSALTGTPIQSPNVGDLICVAGAQIEFLGQENKFMPNVAFVNPKQIKLLKLEKDANDQYLLPNWLSANGTEVDMIQLVGNPLVPENEAYVMDSTKGTIYERKAVEVAMAYENNDNFETETVTVKGLVRSNLWVSANNSNAFMHIADIAAGITAITKP
jgi:HK97 family phage major capsid protein